MTDQDIEKSPRRRFKWPLSRQRFIELSVVVFGVMIALGLENLVEEMRLRGDARVLERSFREDIFNAIDLSLERQIISSCLSEKLNALTQRVLAVDNGWEAAPTAEFGGIDFALPQAYRAPTRTWTTASFDRALGTEAFKRIPSERAHAYARLFAQIERRREDNIAEYTAISGLAPLSFSLKEVDSESRLELLQILAAVDRYRALALVQSNQIIEAALNLPGGADIRNEILASRENSDAALHSLEGAYGECIDRGAYERLVQEAAER